MIIKNNSVEQINIALLELEDRIQRISNATDIKIIKASLESILRNLNETKNGLESGETYNINITGHASTATNADHASNADSSTTSEKATKDGSGNVISTTYQKTSEKNTVAGYVSCDKTANGTYFLSATVNNGTVTYSWVTLN